MFELFNSARDKEVVFTSSHKFFVCQILFDTCDHMIILLMFCVIYLLAYFIYLFVQVRVHVCLLVMQIQVASIMGHKAGEHPGQNGSPLQGTYWAYTRLETPISRTAQYHHIGVCEIPVRYLLKQEI